MTANQSLLSFCKPDSQLAEVDTGGRWSSHPYFLGEKRVSGTWSYSFLLSAPYAAGQCKPRSVRAPATFTAAPLEYSYFTF